MNVLKNLIKIATTASFIVILSAAPSFAIIETCVGEGTKYPNLSTKGGPDTDYSVRCRQIFDPELDEYVTLYAKTNSDCAKSGEIESDSDACPEPEEPMTEEQKIIDEATGSEIDYDDAGEEPEAENPDVAGPSEKQSSESKGLSLPLIIALVVAAVVVVAAIVVLIVISKKKGNKTSKPTDATAPTMPQMNPETPIAPVEPPKPVEPVQTNPQATNDTPPSDNPFAKQ